MNRTRSMADILANVSTPAYNPLENPKVTQAKAAPEIYAAIRSAVGEMQDELIATLLEKHIQRSATAADWGKLTVKFEMPALFARLNIYYKDELIGTIGTPHIGNEVYVEVEG